MEDDVGIEKFALPETCPEEVAAKSLYCTRDGLEYRVQGI